MYDKLQNHPYGKNIVGHCTTTLQISRAAYDEIRAALVHAGQTGRIVDDAGGKTFEGIDMQGVMLQSLEVPVMPSLEGKPRFIPESL